MRTSTQTVEIAARPEDVFEFVADPERLPTWAIGFAKGIRREDGGWLVRTATGAQLPLRVEADAATGVVDFVVDGVPARTRVVANDGGAEYVFTMFQPPQMPDDLFTGQIAELGRELTVLKAHLESACPL